MTTGKRLALAVLLVLTLASRALVAPGMMPGRDGAGQLVLEICSSPELPRQTVTVPVKHAPKHGDKDAREHCPFTAMAHATLLGAAPVLADHLVMAGYHQHQHIHALKLAATRALPPSTGPPAYLA